jgi:hypothetical protein
MGGGQQQGDGGAQFASLDTGTATDAGGGFNLGYDFTMAAQDEGIGEPPDLGLDFLSPPTDVTPEQYEQIPVPQDVPGREFAERERPGQQFAALTSTPMGGEPGGPKTYGPGSQLFMAATPSTAGPTEPEEERRAEQETRGAEPTTTEPTTPAAAPAPAPTTTEPTPRAAAEPEPVTLPTVDVAAPGYGGGKGGPSILDSDIIPQDTEPVSAPAGTEPAVTTTEPGTEPVVSQPTAPETTPTPGLAAPPPTEPTTEPTPGLAAPPPEDTTAPPPTEAAPERSVLERIADYIPSVVTPAEAKAKGTNAEKVEKSEKDYEKQSGAPISETNPMLTVYGPGQGKTEAERKMEGPKVDSLGQDAKVIQDAMSGKNGYSTVAGRSDLMGRTGTITLPEGGKIPVIQTDRLETKDANHVDVAVADKNDKAFADYIANSQITWDPAPNPALVFDQKMGTGKNAPDADAARTFQQNTGYSGTGAPTRGEIERVGTVPGTEAADRTGGLAGLQQYAALDTGTMVDAGKADDANEDDSLPTGMDIAGDQPIGVLGEKWAANAGARTDALRAIGSNIADRNSVTGKIENSAVRDSRDYIMDTARIGDTMRQQGVREAIDRLHPEFALQLAGAIQDARSRGMDVGVFSAYRAPEMRANPGYAQVSAHGMGVAVDMYGVGRPGSALSNEWYAIARDWGLHNPYGPSNGKEWNHYQLLPETGRELAGRVGANPSGAISGTALEQRWERTAPISDAVRSVPEASQPGPQPSVPLPEARPEGAPRAPVEGYGDLAQGWQFQAPPMETTPTDQPYDQPFGPVDYRADYAPQVVPPTTEELLTGSRLAAPDQAFDQPTGGLDYRADYAPSVVAPTTEEILTGGLINEGARPGVTGAYDVGTEARIPLGADPTILLPGQEAPGMGGWPMPAFTPTTAGPAYPVFAVERAGGLPMVPGLPVSPTGGESLQPGQQAPGVASTPEELTTALLPQGYEQPSVPPSLAQQAELLGLGGYEQPPSVGGEVASLTPEDIERGLTYPSPGAGIPPPPEVERTELPEIEGERPPVEGARDVETEERAPPLSDADREALEPPAEPLSDADREALEPPPGMSLEDLRAGRISPEAAREGYDITPQRSAELVSEAERALYGPAAGAERYTAPIGPVGPHEVRDARAFDNNVRTVLSNVTPDVRDKLTPYLGLVTERDKLNLMSGRITAEQLVFQKQNEYYASQRQNGYSLSTVQGYLNSNYPGGIAALQRDLTRSGTVTPTEPYLPAGTLPQGAPPAPAPAAPAPAPGVPYEQVPIPEDEYGRPPAPEQAAPPMVTTPPLDIRPPGAPGGIFPIGPDPNVDYYSVPPYAPPVAPAPPTVVPPVTPPVTAPPAVPPSVSPPAAPPAAPVAPAPAAPQVAGGVPAAALAAMMGVMGPADASYFGGDQTAALAQQVQTAMRTNPARIAAAMDANPMMGMMLASIFTPEQLSQMFADAGFGRNERNPPMRGDGNQQQQDQQQPATAAQGGLVSMPGYYQQGGSEEREPDRPRYRGPTTSDDPMYRPPRSKLDYRPNYDTRPWEAAPWPSEPQGPFLPEDEGEDEFGKIPMPRPRPKAAPRYQRGGLIPLRRQQGGGLGDQAPWPQRPPSQGRPLPPQEGPLPRALPGESLDDYARRVNPADYARHMRPLERARGGGLGPDYLKGEAEEAEQNSKMVTRSFTPEEQAKPFGFQAGGLTLGAMNTLSGQAHYGGLNLQRAIPKRPDIHLISSATPGRVDRIPMRARTGSYVLPADVVSGLGQGNTMAGAKMWGQSISHSIGPMGIQNAIKQRSLKMPSLRMPSPQPSRSVYGPDKIALASPKGPSWPFADGGETEFTPIVTAGGEVVIDPEIVAALGEGDAAAGKKMLANSVEQVRKQTIQHMKKLPGPVA